MGVKEGPESQVRAAVAECFSVFREFEAVSTVLEYFQETKLSAGDFRSFALGQSPKISRPGIFIVIYFCAEC